MNHKCLLISAVALVCAGSAWGQSTLGEILDQGATKISKEEWMARMPVTTSDIWPASVGRRGETQYTYNVDGTLSGSLYDYTSATSSDGNGTWTVDDSGKVCTVQRNSAPGWPSSYRECSIRYQLGDMYFRIVSDPDRSAKIMKTVISK
jgi:hypothetical protein